MSAPHTRRRFLTDLLFAGGIVAVSAGLAFVGTEALQSQPSPTPSTAPDIAATPRSCDVPPPVAATPEPLHYNAGGEPMPPPPREYNTAGGRAAPLPQQRHAPSGKVQAAPPEGR